MKNLTLITLFSTILLLSGCGEGDTTNIQQSEEKKFQTITPERYLLENYKKIKDEDVLKYLKALNENDKLTLKIYEAWGNYLLYRACKVDESMTLEMSQGVKNCQQNYREWLNTAYTLYTIDTPNYVDFNSWYQNSPRPLLNDKVFDYAYEQANKQLIAIKCDTKEIDKQTCATYFNSQAQFQNNINSLNDSRVRSYEEMSQELYGCTYEGQILEDGSVCVLF